MNKTLGCISLALLLSAGLSYITHAEASPAPPKPTVFPEIPPQFISLKPGAVKPTGWLKDWANAAANGITGDLDKRAAVFEHGYKGYAFKARGVKAEGTGWPLEQCAYWLDGLVRLAYILDDELLINKAKSRLDPIVDAVLNGADSFIYWRPKSELNNAFNNWAHSHMGRALVAYYKATEDKRILDALVKVYADYPPLPVLRQDFRLPVSGACNIDPMLETYALSGDKRILDHVLQFAGTEKFKELVSALAGGQVPYGHAVVFYENVRIPALLYPWTGDVAMLRATQQSLDQAIENHGLPMGLDSSEEYLANIGSTRHVEACNVACAGYTHGWMLQLAGDRRHADLMERIFFNAAGATISRDYQTMAYYQCPNQTGAFPVDPSAGGTKEFDPTAESVLCCVGNSSRIIPNYIMSMWMITADAGLAATTYGPNRLETKTDNGTGLVIESKTDYPFGEAINMLVQPENPVSFPLYLRIPTWCRRPELRVNGNVQKIQIDDHGFARILRKWQKDDRVTLTLPMQVKIELGRETPFPPDSYFGGRPLSKVKDIDNPFTFVSYGPLLFALAIPDLDPNTVSPGAHCHYGLDADPVHPDSKVSVSPQPRPKHWQWQLDAPVKLQIPAREYDWNPTEQQPLPKTPVSGGEPSMVTLVPYGCTKFRISMFPVTAKTTPLPPDP